MTTVRNANGDPVSFEEAVARMDDSIREEMLHSYAPALNNPQAYFEEYARRHAEKYLQPFPPYSGGRQ